MYLIGGPLRIAFLIVQAGLLIFAAFGLMPFTHALAPTILLMGSVAGFAVAVALAEVVSVFRWFWLLAIDR